MPRCEQLGPHASQVFAPEVATPDLPGPGLPLREFGSAGVLALPTVAMPLCFVAPHHGPGTFVEEGVSVPGGVGYGPFFLLHGLEAIQEPAPAIDEEHGGVAPDAEGSDLCGRDSPLPPVAGTDGIEVLQDVLQRELQELGQLPRHAEHVRALLEGAGQDLVSGKELVADLPQRSQGLAQADLRVHAVVYHLHGGGAVGPLVGGMQEVGLRPADHVDGLVRFGLAQLPEHGLLDVAGDLRLAPGIVLAGQAELQGGHGEIVMAFVAVSGVAPPAASSPDDDRHMGKPLCVLVLEKRFPQLRDMVLPVGLESPDKLAPAAAHEYVI